MVLIAYKVASMIWLNSYVPQVLPIITNATGLIFKVLWKLHYIKNNNINYFSTVLINL